MNGQKESEARNNGALFTYVIVHGKLHLADGKRCL